jgi:hypothetical protein
VGSGYGTAVQIILDIIVPVFGIVGLGYVAARFGLFPADANKGLSRFVFDFAIPALLFRTMATTGLPADIEWGYLISYFGGGYISWITGTALAYLLFRRAGAEPAIAGMTAGFSNTVLLGVPLILTTFGESGTLPIFLLIACHSWQLLSVVTIQAEVGIGARDEMRKLPANVAKGLVRNPIIWALVLGVAANLTGLPMPDFADTLLEMLGRAALPCALFAMGASLAAYRIVGALPQASVGSLLKLGLHPAATYLLATYVFEVTPLWRDVAVIVAALPVGVNVYMMAQRYDAGVAPAATALILSTAGSVGSIAIVLWVLGVR